MLQAVVAEHVCLLRSGPSTTTETETVAKYEIMDGAPVKGESIPIRLFLAGYDLTPTMRDVNKKFSVRYFLNLVLVDEEDRRYFKQQVRRPRPLASAGVTVAFVTPTFACLSPGDRPVEKSSREAEEKELPPTLRVARAPDPTGERRAAGDVSLLLWTRPQLLPARQPEVRRPSLPPRHN